MCPLLKDLGKLERSGMSCSAGTSCLEEPSFWQACRIAVSGDLHIRLANSYYDAKQIRDVLHSAWKVQAGDDYFYEEFNHPGRIFKNLIEPSTRVHDLYKLSALCLVAELGNKEIVATLSLVFDNRLKTIEAGRGAVKQEFKGERILQRFVQPVLAILSSFPDYALILDTTTLVNSSSYFAENLGASPYAFHPSSFAVSKLSVKKWLEEIACKRGEDVALTLLAKSSLTGLGRFATAYYLRLPSQLHVYTPLLTDKQYPFYSRSQESLQVEVDKEKQALSVQHSLLYDRHFTATRIIFCPHPSIDIGKVIDLSGKQGYETIVVQVPCDVQYLSLSNHMEKHGALLCGVFPVITGQWYASYFVACSDGHRQIVTGNLHFLARHRPLTDSVMELVDLMVHSL